MKKGIALAAFAALGIVACSRPAAHADPCADARPGDGTTRTAACMRTNADPFASPWSGAWTGITYAGSVPLRCSFTFDKGSTYAEDERRLILRGRVACRLESGESTHDDVRAVEDARDGRLSVYLMKPSGFIQPIGVLYQGADGARTFYPDRTTPLQPMPVARP